MHYLGEINLLKLDLVLCRFFRLASVVVRLRLELDYGRFFNDSLDGHGDKFIEGLQLLTNKTFFVEIRSDNRPTGLMPRVWL